MGKLVNLNGNLQGEEKPAEEKICPFISMPVMIGTRPASTLDPRPMPVFDVVRVACLKDACKLWVDGHPEGRCSVELGVFPRAELS